MLAILAPGQGAQTPGMLGPWLDLPAAARTIRWAAAVTGLDLVRLGTTATAEEIRDTAVAQPLLVTAGLAAAAELFDDGELPVAVVAGHSVGELTVAALAGALSVEAALIFVTARGQEMARAAAQTPTGMTAVLGGDPVAVDAALEHHGLTAANRNGAGQLVAAGEHEALAAFAADPPPGARLRPLAVAGAFHTAFMKPARDTLAELAAVLPVADPRVPIVSNADGSLVTHGADLLDRLVAQVGDPVRWDLCMETIGSLDVTATIELPPAGTLTGLLRRALPHLETFALRDVADLPGARALVETHAHAHVAAAPAWRLTVAPLAGVFHRQPLTPGASLDPGDSLGRVQARRDGADVDAPYGGVLIEWLAEDGDPVSAGQPVARLHPAAP